MEMVKSVILAAGAGTRMKSETPKVLHKIFGKPMIEYVLDTAEKSGASENIIVIGHKGELVEEMINERAVFVTQSERLGTAHAVKMAEDYLDFDGEVLILYGDTPLITEKTIKEATEIHRKNKNDLTLISAIVEDSTGYGRIVRDGKNVKSIVEHKDANEEQLKIKEINTGIYIFNAKVLKATLGKIKNNNTQNEYYLTDALEIILSEGGLADCYIAENPEEFLGVNDRIQLVTATEILKERTNKALMLDGVTIVSPETAFINPDAKIGRDTIIYPNVIIEGATIIGQNCFVGSGSKIIDSVIGDSVNIESSFILKSKVGDRTTVGPFAYMRPGNVVGTDCKIGDFVEVKNSNIGNNTKASHLTYIGDSDLGNNINLGCGTVTVNYDGKNKFRTTIEDNCFIGCNANLVAPVTIKEDSFVAAGSTITSDVPENSLAIARARQVIKENWEKPKKN